LIFFLFNRKSFQAGRICGSHHKCGDGNSIILGNTITHDAGPKRLPTGMMACHAWPVRVL